jgi:hypothetical protein
MTHENNIRVAADQCSELTKGIKIVQNDQKAYDYTAAVAKITAESPQELKAASPVGLRFNEGKVRWDLIDPTAVEGVAAVLSFGCKKYTAENWRKGLSWKSTLRSLESHLQALKRGEDIDPESGLPHIDHLGCNWMFFSNYQKMGIGEDDRVKVTKSIQEKADKLLADRQTEWKARQQ